MTDPLRSVLAAADIDVDEVDAAVREVLSRPEYDSLRTSGPEAWLERAGGIVAEWLAEVLGRQGTAVAAWLLLGLATILVIVVVVRLATRMAPEPSTEASPLAVVGRGPAAWLADADAATARGDHREALRCAFRSLIARLAEAGIVDEVAGTTVGEYRRQVATAAPTRRADFDRASDAFEAVWYGHAEADPGVVADVRSMAASRPATASAGRR